MGPAPKAVVLVSSLLLSMGVGCTAIVGSFSEGTGPTDSGGQHETTPGMDAASDTPVDTAMHPDTGHKDSGHDAGPDVVDDVTADVTDAPVDVVTDVGPDVPVVAANTGMAMTAGGGFSRSKSFTLQGAVGQAPGGNTSSSSTSFKLRGGIIGATQ